jgi:pimeloyl-ACP methyl ester carboxylesterase
VFELGRFDRVTAPTLFLGGCESVPEVARAAQAAAAAIPNAQIRLLHGHGHFAHKTDPAMVCVIVKDFIPS